MTLAKVSASTTGPLNASSCGSVSRVSCTAVGGAPAMFAKGSAPIPAAAAAAPAIRAAFSAASLACRCNSLACICMNVATPAAAASCAVALARASAYGPAVAASVLQAASSAAAGAAPSTSLSDEFRSWSADSSTTCLTPISARASARLGWTPSAAATHARAASSTSLAPDASPPRDTAASGCLCSALSPPAPVEPTEHMSGRLLKNGSTLA